MKRDSRRALQGLKMTGLGRQLRRMGIPKKRTAQGMFYGVKKLEKPAEAEVENVEKNFSQISRISQISEKEFSQSSQSAENNFSQIAQIPQSSEKVFSQSAQGPQSAENPEEPQDSFDTFGSYSESKLTPHQRPD